MKDLQKHINTLRRDFSLEQLEESAVEKNPILQFAKWYREAIDAQLVDPNAMLVSTVSSDRKPSTRVMLLRDFDENGFVFYTNYNSRKGKEILENPYTSITFFWIELERQIRIEGKIEKQSPEESDSYFNSRPRESQLGAWASAQSTSILGRNELEGKLVEIALKFNDKEVHRPPFWGGYRLKPTHIEFWQGRPSRLHDRIVYSLTDEGSWEIGRLSP